MKSSESENEEDLVKLCDFVKEDDLVKLLESENSGNFEESLWGIIRFRKTKSSSFSENSGNFEESLDFEKKEDF